MDLCILTQRQSTGEPLDQKYTPSESLHEDFSFDLPSINGLFNRTLTFTLGFTVGTFVFIDKYFVGVAVGKLVGLPVGDVEEKHDEQVFGQCTLAAKTVQVPY